MSTTLSTSIDIVDMSDGVVTKEACGRSLTTEDAADLPLLTLDPVYGESVQDGTPTPDAPVYIQAVRGRNLLKPINSSTINGVTFTVLDDGSVIVNGTATAQTHFKIFTSGTETSLQPGIYTVSGCPSGGTTSTYMITRRLYNDGSHKSYAADVGNGTTFTQQGTGGDYLYEVYIEIKANVNVNNLVFYPQMEYGSTVHEYVPYNHLALVSSTGSVTYLDLTDPSTGEPVELHGLDDTYRDILRIDASGHAVVEKRVGKFYLDGSENFPTPSTNYTDLPYSLAHGKDGYTNNGVYQPAPLEKNNLGGVQNPDSSRTSGSFNAWVYSNSTTTPAHTTLRVPGTVQGFYTTAAEMKTWFASHHLEVLYPIVLSAWHTIDLGYVDLPEVTDGSTVYVAAEVQPNICGSWWTHAGEQTGIAYRAQQNGLAKTEVTYQLGTSGTTPPTGTWSSTPSAPTTTQFLWTRTVFTFTNGDTKTAYSVGGLKGEQGATGPAGSSAQATVTAVSSGAITASSSGFSLTTGATIELYTAGYSQTTVGAVTLNVAGTGAKTVKVDNVVTSTTNALLFTSYSRMSFTYDGTYWVLTTEAASYKGYCGTAAATAAKVVSNVVGTNSTTASNTSVVVRRGTRVSARMVYANTAASATMNFAGLGALYVYQGASLLDGLYNWYNADSIDFVFSGNNWVLQSRGAARIATDQGDSVLFHPSGDMTNGVKIGTWTWNSSNQTAVEILYAEELRAVYGTGMWVFPPGDSTHPIFEAGLNPSSYKPFVTIGSHAATSTLNASWNKFYIQIVDDYMFWARGNTLYGQIKNVTSGFADNTRGTIDNYNNMTGLRMYFGRNAEDANGTTTSQASSIMQTQSVDDDNYLSFMNGGSDSTNCSWLGIYNIKGSLAFQKIEEVRIQNYATPNRLGAEMWAMKDSTSSDSAYWSESYATSAWFHYSPYNDSSKTFDYLEHRQHARWDRYIYGSTRRLAGKIYGDTNDHVVQYYDVQYGAQYVYGYEQWDTTSTSDRRVTASFYGTSSSTYYISVFGNNSISSQASTWMVSRYFSSGTQQTEAIAQQYAYSSTASQSVKVIGTNSYPYAEMYEYYGGTYASMYTRAYYSSTVYTRTYVYAASNQTYSDTYAYYSSTRYAWNRTDATSTQAIFSAGAYYSNTVYSHMYFYGQSTPVIEQTVYNGSYYTYARLEPYMFIIRSTIAGSSQNVGLRIKNNTYQAEFMHSSASHRVGIYVDNHSNWAIAWASNSSTDAVLFGKTFNVTSSLAYKTSVSGSVSVSVTIAHTRNSIRSSNTATITSQLSASSWTSAGRTNVDVTVSKSSYYALSAQATTNNNDVCIKSILYSTPGTSAGSGTCKCTVYVWNMRSTAQNANTIIVTLNVIWVANSASGSGTGTQTLTSS